MSARRWSSLKPLPTAFVGRAETRRALAAAVDRALLTRLVHEASDAAILCPSFYRADVVHNPTKWERSFARFRSGIIAALQRRREARRLTFGVGK